MKDALVRLYEWYNDNKPTSVSPQNVNEPPKVRLVVDDEEEEGLAFLTSQFNRHLELEDNIGDKSEVDKFLLESREVEDNNFDLLGWWKNNVTEYQILSRVTRDVFAIPVSTVASESAFSTGGRVLDPFRSSLLPNTIEAPICTQNWIRSSSTPISLRDAMDEVEQLEKLDSGNILFNIFLLT